MSKKQKIIASVISVLGFMAIILFSLTFFGCSGGGNSKPAAANESMGTYGVRKDIEEYVLTTYPDSAQKRAALMSYAKHLQEGYDKAMNDPNMTKEDAISIDSKKIRDLNCLRLLGGLQEKGDPIGTVAEKTTYSSDMEVLKKRIAARQKYESLLAFAVIPFSSSNETIETACDSN